MKRVTLDIDYKKFKPYAIKEAESIGRIQHKIIKCKNLYSMQTEISPSTNGYHITIWCRGCPQCRLAYDDQKRFSNDSNLRSPHQQNILFDGYTINGKHAPITL